MADIFYKIYERIGGYFTGTERRRRFWEAVFLVFLFTIFLEFYYKILIPQEILYWVFSSIVQALVALVALLGVVAVFKLQVLHDQGRRIIDAALSPTPFTYLYASLCNQTITSIEELSWEINRILKDGEDREPRVKELKERIDNLFLSKNLITDLAIKFSVYTFAVAIIALLLLISSSLLYEYFLGLPILFLIFILTAYSFFLAIKGVAAAIQ